jgi:hypothetical protein
MGLQAAIDSRNGRWQAKVWARVRHPSLEALHAQSAKSVLASRQRAAARIEAAPPRRPFPAQWRLQRSAPVKGRSIDLRRTNAQGGVTRLGHTFAVDPLWSHRLVRCEVDIDAAVIRFYAWRRRESDWQPLLRQVPYQRSQRYYSSCHGGADTGHCIKF